MSKIKITEEKTITVSNESTEKRYGNSISLVAKVNKTHLLEFTIWSEIGHVTFNGNKITEFQNLFMQFVDAIKANNDNSHN